MTRSIKNTIANVAPSIVLKTIHDDIMRANANATLTTKIMRAKLRVTMNDVHVRNSSWIFTTTQYDVVRAMFDNDYRAKIERANKRVTSSRKRVTKTKRTAKTNDVVIDANETNDA